MMTNKRRFYFITKLIEKSLELKESGGHDVFVEWEPHVDWVNVRAFSGPFDVTKFPKYFYIDFSLESVYSVYKEAMQYLDNMGKTSESEAQNG